MADGLLNKASIILTPTGYKAGTLYNVAPVVEPYEDFDFARASVASRVNSSGLVEMVGRTLGSELVTNGDFATDSDWTLGTDWSIGDNALVGNSSITENEQRIFTTSVSRFLKITFDAVVTSGEVAVYMEGSTKQWVSTTGSYTIYDNSSAFDLEIDGRNSNPFTGSITNVSVKEIIDTNNIPRISYDSNGDNGHILLEPTSTNLVP